MTHSHWTEPYQPGEHLLWEGRPTRAMLALESFIGLILLAAVSGSLGWILTFQTNRIVNCEAMVTTGCKITIYALWTILLLTVIAFAVIARDMTSPTRHMGQFFALTNHRAFVMDVRDKLRFQTIELGTVEVTTGLGRLSFGDPETPEMSFVGLSRDELRIAKSIATDRGERT